MVLPVSSKSCGLGGTWLQFQQRSPRSSGSKKTDAWHEQTDTQSPSRTSARRQTPSATRPRPDGSRKPDEKAPSNTARKNLGYSRHQTLTGSPGRGGLEWSSGSKIKTGSVPKCRSARAVSERGLESAHEKDSSVLTPSSGWPGMNRWNKKTASEGRSGGVDGA